MKNKDMPINPTEKSRYEFAGSGLTKREYFAGLAMANLSSSVLNKAQEESVARLSVKLADALLAALEESE
jgi:hypothetical protein